MSANDRERSAEQVLAERIGLDSETVGGAAIARALGTRMSALGLHDRDEYLRHLSGSDLEQQELVEEVVVPESWFFRDERPFAALRDHVTARRDAAIVAAPGPPLRVLSVPCGYGEEPYSIAITLLDLELAPDRFQIDAVDVSARHLAVAQRGAYRGHSFRGTNLGFRDRYFRPNSEAQSFTLDSSVRAAVRFTRGNLLDPGLLSGHPPYDIIFCRNVLIYFDAASRRRALATLDRLLGPAGLLFVGHSERLAIDDRRFQASGENASFTLRRANVRDEPERAQRAIPPTPALAPKRGGRDVAAPASRYETAVPLPESSVRLLAEAAVLADRGEHDAAASVCETVIARFGPSAAVFFLRGLVRQAGGRVAEAEADFRKTIYLEPGHDEALLALALIAQRRGDAESAAAYRRRADRARAKKGTS